MTLPAPLDSVETPAEGASPSAPSLHSGGFAAWCVRRRLPLLALAAVCCIAASFYQQVRFDRSIENMFAPDDPLLPSFQKLRREFGGDEVVVVAYTDPDLLTTGVERLERLTEQLRNTPGIDPKSVLGLDSSPWNNPMPFLDFFEGMAVGADHQTTAVLCSLTPESETPGVTRAETIRRVRALAVAHDPSAVVVGEAVMVVDGFDYLEQDGVLLARSAAGLLLLVVVVLFRGLRWAVAPLGVVFAALWWTQGVIVAGNFQLSMVSSMLTAIVAVVGVATVVHFLVRFRAARDAGMTGEQAMVSAGQWLWAPIAWACLTDAVGFGALAVSRVGPVQSFGVMMALGAVLTLAAAVCVLPGLLMFSCGGAATKPAWGEGKLDAALQGMAAQVQRRPKWVAAGTVGLTLFAAWGASRLEVETDFTRNFRADSPISTAYRFVEDNLGGAGAWDVLIPVHRKLDREYLNHLRDYQDRLRTEVTVPGPDGQPTPGLTKVVSLVDALDAMENADPSGGALARRTPLRLRISMMEKGVAPFAAAVHKAVDGETQYLRVMLRSREQQAAAAKSSLIEQVRRITAEEFPDAEVTGYFVLLASLIESLLRDQWSTFALASLGVFVMLAAAFRSVPLALAALIPNALPIVGVLGALGWLGLKMNMGAVMIASVSMGLAVDSSIHYFNAVRRLRASGASWDDAIASAHQNVGRAMVFSTAALVFGFLALGLSHFIPTVYFGFLVSLAMLGGLAGNLVLLPVLLRWLSPWVRW